MKPHLLDSGRCHNCGAAVSGKFCAECGQETTLHVASAREFLHEFVGHYIALEGKLWKTLALLLFSPGKLTTEYIAGRRARYVQPLRIYLTFSILFFALLKYGPHQLIESGAPGSQVVAAENVRVNSKLGTINPAWELKLKRIVTMPREQSIALGKSIFFGYVPYVMFCLMPVFALFLKLLYLPSGRRYGEHVLFALHTNAFAFLMLGLIQAVPWTWVNIALMVWLLAYLPIAMQRVYGGGKLVTGVRWAVLMTVYAITASAAVTGTLFAAAVVF
ncbi:MAG: DUF3667 domain-containing protein [Pseudomonadota bacterium]